MARWRRSCRAWRATRTRRGCCASSSRRDLVGPIVATVAPDAPALRGALVASQLIGLALARYVLRLEPLASADHAAVVAAVAPNLQRYLTGPLDARSAP